LKLRHNAKSRFGGKGAVRPEPHSGTSKSLLVTVTTLVVASFDDARSSGE
jgi:hypothetical protein